MEVSNKIKEEIRRTQLDLKNAIRFHQIWVARLQEDENNVHFKTKVKEAEKDIVAIGHTQKLVVDRLRRELELYQQRLKARNKPINTENDNRYVAQQLRDHHIQYRTRTRSISLLKPSVLSEIHIKAENNYDNGKENISDSENEIKSNNEKENSSLSEVEDKDKYPNHYSQMTNNVSDSRSNFANALNKVKESLIRRSDVGDMGDVAVWPSGVSISGSESGSSCAPLSPSPSPPPLPDPATPMSQDTFLRLVGLVTHSQKEILERKRTERRKRATTSTNRTDFLYGNFENMMPTKRKKYNNFPYLQPHNDPPQTRSAKLKKQQIQPKSREGSPSGSSSENNNKSFSGDKPSWANALPAGLTVEPIFTPSKKVCHGCGRSDVPSLLVWCGTCGVCVHTGCGVDGRCPAGECRAKLPDPALTPTHGTLSDNDTHIDTQIYKDKLAERKRLQEKNIELCEELRKLEARAASLKENLDEHNAEKRQLLAAQIKTQRNLQKLLDFISQFKETSVSVRSTSISDTASDLSKSNEE